MQIRKAYKEVSPELLFAEIKDFILKQGVNLGENKMETYTLPDESASFGTRATLTFNVEGLEARDVGIMLDVDHNIAARTGLHCAPLVHEQIGTAKIHGSVRFGIGPFNTKEDVDTAVNAVREIAMSRKQTSSFSRQA